MLLLRATLSGFRNLDSAETEFGPQFTVFYGHNGAGKTNLLEAIYFVSTLRSFRTTETRALVGRGRPAANIELAVYEPAVGLESKLAVRLDIGERSTRRLASCDGKAVRPAAEFYGRLRTLLFTPEDLSVLRGSPSGRRQLLDRAVFARERAHIHDVLRYEKLVRSRNHLLRGNLEASTGERERLLDTYDDGLADVGARIWTRRVNVVEDLQTGFRGAFQDIQGTDVRCAMAYECRIADIPVEATEAERRAGLGQALRDRRAHDERRGATSVGPHRDDLRVELEGMLAATFASQGQSRSLVLAFKIAELRSARERFGHAPLLLLDDVSSELDPERSAHLFETLAREAGQCLLTTTAPHFIALGSSVHRLNVEVRAGRLFAEA